MMYYKHRKELADKYERWIQEYGVMNCPLSVITYLDANKFLNEDKISEFLKSCSHKENLS